MTSRRPNGKEKALQETGKVEMEPGTSVMEPADNELQKCS